MPEMRSYDQGGRGHVVRPRWTWSGLLLMLLGLSGIAWGAIVLSWTPAIVGAVVLALGAAAALHGGLLYDVHGNTSLHAEVHDVIHNETHRGPDPGVMRTQADVERQFRERRRRKS